MSQILVIDLALELEYLTGWGRDSMEFIANAFGAVTRHYDNPIYEQIQLFEKEAARKVSTFFTKLMKLIDEGTVFLNSITVF